MLIVAPCPCGKQLRANESLIGQTIQCNLCRRFVPVPDPTAVPERPRGPVEDPPPPAGSPREYCYWLLALAFFPLAFSLSEKHERLDKRFERAMQRAPEEVQEQVERLMQDGTTTLDDLVSVFPDGRLDDQAYLPRHTRMHWLYALVATGSFLLLLFLIFTPGTVAPGHLPLVGLFTGTIGVALLLVVQDTGILALLIDLSMLAATDPSKSFLTSWAGFTFGVGLLEEWCKLLPLLWLYKRKGVVSWRVACLWGMASGVGFGVSEGVLYSATMYNGIFPAAIYVVRFASCVALHAVWSASAGLSLYHNQDLFRVTSQWYERAVVILKTLTVVMFLHGLFDTLLTRQLNFPALMVAAVSFAYLAWQIESTREQEAARAGAAAPAAGAEAAAETTPATAAVQ